MDVIRIFTNPPVCLERVLQYDAMVFAIARASLFKVNMAAFPIHSPRRHTQSAQSQVAYGVNIDKEVYEGGGYRTKGFCRSCVPGPKSGLPIVLLDEPLAALEEGE